MSDIEYGKKCDHDTCHCVTRSETAVVQGKSVFCASGCAEGRGCSHPGCNCQSSSSQAAGS